MGLPTRSTTEADAIVEAYLAIAAGNASAALRMVIRDAMADLCEIDRRSTARARLISRGYARAAVASGGT